MIIIGFGIDPIDPWLINYRRTSFMFAQENKSLFVLDFNRFTVLCSHSKQMRFTLISSQTGSGDMTPTGGCQTEGGGV